MADDITAKGNQPSAPNEGFSSKTLAGLAGTGTAIGSGFIKTSSDKRVWDHYLSAIRAIETGSPGAVLRTFRTSELLSPLETWSQVGVSRQEMQAAGVYSSYLKKTFGSTTSLNLIRTGNIFGEVRGDSGQLLGYGLQIEPGGMRGDALADYYARITGTRLSPTESLNDSLLRAKWEGSGSKESFGSWVQQLDHFDKKQRLIIGSPIRKSLSLLGFNYSLTEQVSANLAKIETVTNLARSKAASAFGRLNNLLRKPLDIPVIGGVLSKIPGLRSMAVAPGTSLSMVGAFTKKAMVAGAAWKGLDYLDYLRSEGSIWSPILGTLGGGLAGAFIGKKAGQKFSKPGLIAGAALGLYSGIAPRFEKGIFHGAASIGADINLLRADVSNTVGLTGSLKEQQAVTPDFVSLGTAAGFAGVGGLAVGTGEYLSFLAKSGGERLKGGTFAKVFETMRESTATRIGDKIWDSSIGRKVLKVPGLSKLSKVRSGFGVGLLGGLVAWQAAATGLSLMAGNPLAAIPGVGLLGSSETPNELQEVYSGREEVAIRKGRWWELGRGQAYEGGRIDYYRPHMLARLADRSYQKGMWGDESEKWDYDPMLHPLDALFGTDSWKYHYEQKYQYERPAPLTGTYGENIPFIGPAIAATFGKLIKPRKEVRPNEWNLGEGNYLHRPDIRSEEEPAYELGGLAPGSPVAPEESSQLLNALNYRRREAIGLVGYAEQEQTKALLGREELFQNLQTMGTMGKETGSEYWLWKHMNLGGALGSSEAIRRFIPRTPSYLDTYNPLRNTLPSWIPEDYFTDLKYGNPFEKLPEAELRLPGEGYASRYPELKGVSPEDYPIAHKVKILGDIAMYSSEYKSYLSMAKRQAKQMSLQEVQIVQETERQVMEKKKRREFQEYAFSGQDLESQNVTVTEVLSPSRFRTEEYGATILEMSGVGAMKGSGATDRVRELIEGRSINIYSPSFDANKFDMVTSGPRMKVAAMLGDTDIGTILAQEGLTREEEMGEEFAQLRFSANERLAGRAGEFLMHGAETPLEYLTPMSPAAKLIRHRSALEEYIAAEAIGTNNAFWDKPVENFIKPAALMGAYKAGITSIPEDTQQRRDISEYFDMLKWVKYSRLEAQARLDNDITNASTFKQSKDTTVFGADVFRNPTNVIRALPRRERDFFQEFSQASSEEERAQILALIPENEQRLYQAQWLKQSAEAAKAKQIAGMATAEDNKIVNNLQMLYGTEGFQYEEGMEDQWARETQGKIAFDDWIREKKAADYFATHSLPGADWIGWNPVVDMEDVKMQYVEQAGLDYHDFDLWGQRELGLARKPYINTEVIAQMAEQAEYQETWKVAKNASSFARQQGMDNGQVRISRVNTASGSGRYNIQVDDQRSRLVDKAYSQLGV